MRRAVFTYLALGVAAVLILAPYLMSVQTSLKTPGQFAQRPPLAPPRPPTGANYAELLVGGHSLIPPLVITVQVVLVVVIGQLTSSVLAAYAFARLDFPGRDAIFRVYLATLMVPAVAVLVPRFVLLGAAGLADTFWGIVLPSMFGSPYAIFLLRQFFRALPRELLDAARLDGAGHLRVLRHVVLPLSRPILATLLIITVVTHWNDFLWPLVVTSGVRWQVLTVAVAALQSQYNGDWTLVMAATTLATLPLLVLFVIFQKHLVRSITVTGMR
ncbi:carbohydrate ABC transporter permease [Actinoplanes regularis]|uniref:Carbohydrate ABC transporter membrane protein 2, CUT1 family n=1 Tax=Actinoplanes regularis TaxID=52697 RepID=A0A238ZK61_9ACTN|nr:carbohydrate ABC transporter permease [Actinoplanes regularis]GIE87633.1 putative sugar ABC transporter, permease protein [Actinoplanes regularis]SNR83690.1 carbohydrate ABC transporter membrane protein 2, CUT1 family [Actinoplanes regularis]